MKLGEQVIRRPRLFTALRVCLFLCLFAIAAFANAPLRSVLPEIMLNGDTPTDEWTKIRTDALGRAYQTVYPGSPVPTNTVYFNSLGQRVKEVDADGVTRLFTFNSLDEQETSGIDANLDGNLDASDVGVVKTITDYTTRSDDGDWTVRRTRIYTYEGGTLTCVATNETALNGQRTWSWTAAGLFKTVTALEGAGLVMTTNWMPNGISTVSAYLNGRLLSQTTKDANGNVTFQTTYTYDPHGRQHTVTDARVNTVTTLAYDDADQVTTTTVSASGLSNQVTTQYWDNRGRVWKITYPDGASVTNQYAATGALTNQAGARTYPVAATNDYAGRLKTLTTWTNRASSQNTATTTWNYDASRGWLSSKRYQDDTGPDYTYTSAGRLRTRTWARNIVATYTNNAAGLLQGITYSDSTPSVALTYDYLGRTKTITQGGSNVITLTYNLAGQVVSEGYTGGPLNGLTVSNRFNDFQQKIAVSVLGIPGASVETGYEYEGGRLKTVTSGNNSATYFYWPNSSLLSNVVFRNGTAERMTTSRNYDGFGRLTRIFSMPTASSAVSFAYAFNPANQRAAVTNADSSRWDFGYDFLGQVTSGKRRWSDNSLVAGQQFEYSFDDIGNRLSSKSGGSASGDGLREAAYQANSLNQYTSRTVPGYVEIQGSATNTATVTVNLQRADRQGDYFHKELAVDNSAGPVWLGVTNIAVLNQATNDLVATNMGHLLIAKASETLGHDLDGNLTNDSRWIYTWDAENRLIRVESAAAVPAAAKAKVEWTFDGLGRRIGEATYTWNTNSSAYRLLQK